MFSIVTGRFNNQTWDYNDKYRKNKNIPCIYACPNKIASSINYDSYVFVIEMNNSTNQIIGIGLIKNKIRNLDKIFKVHEDINYNRYVYTGLYYICRTILYKYNSELIIMLEDILFKGKTHSKRGMGLTKFPIHLLKSYNKEPFNTIEFSLQEEIKNIFISYLRENKCIENNIMI
jgi:hypothetical protein